MSKGHELPQFLTGKDIIIASSYRKDAHFKEVMLVSGIFSSLGLSTYPHPNAEQSRWDEQFVFLGVEDEGLSKIKIERYYLDAIKKARLTYAVTTNGYVGMSASIETAYSLAVGTPVILSQRIQEFGVDVPLPIRSIIKNAQIPILPISKLTDEFNPEAHLSLLRPSLSPAQNRQVFFSLLHMSRQLKIKR